MNNCNHEFVEYTHTSCDTYDVCKYCEMTIDAIALAKVKATLDKERRKIESLRSCFSEVWDSVTDNLGQEELNYIERAHAGDLMILEGE